MTKANPKSAPATIPSDALGGSMFRGPSLASPGHTPEETYALPKAPPGTFPTGKMALDEATPAFNSWAIQANAVYHEGLAFPGYAYLSELAQRPEYRRISETLASEMTREWITLKSKSDQDQTDKISAINDAMKALSVKAIFKEAAEQDGFFGRKAVSIRKMDEIAIT